MKLIITFFIIGLSNLLISQNNYPKNEFRSPVDGTIVLSGTFGELRGNHFHSGIDIKTGGVEGKNIYAVGDGYVSRIKVSPYGFGKAIYIDHPNGYTSVYGHLREYKGKIAEYVHKEHYKRESFSMDIYPDSGLLKVTKGQVIALSGNSGGSGGPHLHFEIRDTKSEHPINPFFFGITVTDNISPVLQRLKVYPLEQSAIINGKNNEAIYSLRKSGKSYYMVPNETIEITGKAGFGISTYDQLNGASNHNGVYAISLYIDSQLIYEHDLELFSFDETRYINSLIDYPYYIKNKNRVQKCFIQPNNKLSIYGDVKNRGYFDFDEDKTYKVQIIVKDWRGNKSEISFKVKGQIKDNKGIVPELNLEAKSLFYWATANIYKSDSFEFEAPENVFYDNTVFNYTTSKMNSRAFSKVHHVMDYYTPIHKPCVIKIKSDTIPEKITSKLVIARKTSKGYWVDNGGIYQDGWISATTKYLGDFQVMADTMPPVIKPVNFYPKKNVSSLGSLKVKIDDDFSGIDYYRGTLNGNWILMDYDYKKDILVYKFDDRIQKGNNQFKLVVKDERGNTKTYSTVVVY